MTDKRLWFFAVVLFGGVLMASSVMAGTTDPQCIAGAKSTFQSCVQDCQEDFREAKYLCRGLDPGCAETCWDAFESCVNPVLDELADCKALCNDDLESGTAWCREHTGWRNDARHKCVDWVQRCAFSCRDRCRESFQPALKACRETYRGCIETCKPTPQ
jgi:hypothetical protein